jgi:hypothetical protein
METFTTEKLIKLVLSLGIDKKIRGPSVHKTREQSEIFSYKLDNKYSSRKVREHSLC